MLASLVTLVRPLLLSAMNSCQVKKLVVELCEKYVATTDNDMDDILLRHVKNALLKDCE